MIIHICRLLVTPKTNNNNCMLYQSIFISAIILSVSYNVSIASIMNNSIEPLPFNIIYVGSESKALLILNNSDFKQQETFYSVNDGEMIDLLTYSNGIVAASVLSDFRNDGYKTDIVFLSLQGKEITRFSPIRNKIVISLSFFNKGKSIAVLCASKKRKHLSKTFYHETLINYKLYVLKDISEKPKKIISIDLPTYTRIPQQAWVNNHLVAESWDPVKNKISILLIDYFNKKFDIHSEYNEDEVYFWKKYPSVYNDKYIGLVEGDKYVLKNQLGQTIETLIPKGAKETFKANSISIDSPIYWINKNSGLFLNRLGEVIEGWYLIEIKNEEILYSKLPDYFNECVENQVVPIIDNQYFLESQTNNESNSK